MRKASWIVVSWLLLAVLSSRASEMRDNNSGAGERIVSLEVLTESDAFVATDRRLAATSDGGRQWRDAFVGSPTETILGAAVRDPANAWLLVSHGGRVDVLRTTDGGQRWSISMLPGELEEGATSGSFSFTGGASGYLMVRLPSSSNWSRGRFFRTGDGGETWTALADPPVAGRIQFVSAQHGWLTGGPAGTDFFETSDSGASWTRVVVPDAGLASAGGPVRLRHELPVFRDARHAVLAVTREAADEATLLTYVTDDQGASWTLTGSTDFTTSGEHAVAVSGDAVLTDAAEGLPAGFDVSRLAVRGGVGLAAATRNHCAESGCWKETRVLLTRDAGASFDEVTPGFLRDANARRRDQAALRVGTDSVIQQNKEGFDIACYPTTSQMQTWWSNGPYKYIGAYIGGRHAYCVNHSSSCPCPPSSWFSTTASQGWTFIPIWVGVQELYGTLDLTSTTTAFNQGVTEANSAADRMSALGFPSGNIVYYDFERPHPSNTTPYVQAFINGWVSQLHSRGHGAGIYGSYLSAAAWGNGSVTSPPDAIWPYNLNSPYKTVFGLCGPSYCLPDNIWSNHQRIRQYAQNVGDAYGGVSLTIDKNYGDGPTASYSSAPPAHPNVTLTTRQVSTNSVPVNQSFTVSATLRVDDATAEHAGISISFPSLTHSGASGNSYDSSQGSVQTSSVSSGATQFYLAPYPSHLLAEADWSNVSAGSSKHFNLTVTPKTSGTFRVRIRAWVTTNAYANAWRDPNSGTLDQQGYRSYEYEVTVSAVDTTSPSVSITSPTSGSTYPATFTPIGIGGNASDNVGVTQVRCTNAATGSTVTASGTTSWNCSVSLLPGSNSITVTARDAANNTASDTLNVSYTPPDSTPPSVTITSPTTNDAYTSGATPISIGGNASDDTGVAGVTCSNGATGSTVSASGTSSWTCSVDLVDGANVITVTARDAANNQSSDTIVVTHSPDPGGGGGTALYLVPPCRVLDTRTIYPLESGIQYGVQLASYCGIPMTAVSVVANVTVVEPTGQGFVTIWPWNLQKPGTSNISFRPGRTRGNDSILMLATDGFGDVRLEPSIDNGGTIHVIIDVTGYFQ